MGSKIENAEKMLISIHSFEGFIPPSPDDSEESMKVLLEKLRQSNHIEAATREDYRLKVKSRTSIFKGKMSSLRRLLSPIGSSVRSQYGRKSNEALTISKLIAKFRGNKITSEAAPLLVTDEQVKEARIVASDQSYGSLLYYFRNIISSLGQLKPAFNPGNKEITIESLQSFADALSTSNNDLSLTQSTMKRTSVERETLYSQIKERMMRLKESIKSQFGTDSVEYRMVKGLRF